MTLLLPWSDPNFWILKKRKDWDPFFRKIEVIKGNIKIEDDDDGIQPKLSLTLDMKMNGNPSKFFAPVKVFQNDTESLIWGIQFTPCGCGIMGVDHAHLFLAVDETGNITRFVHYERFGGAIGRFLLLIDKNDLANAYDAVNKGLKKASEENP